MDVPSDFHLTSLDNFTWEGKSTSLYCLIPGNISSDLSVLQSVLKEIGKYYQGVFFIDGASEHITVNTRDMRIKEIIKICKPLKNVVFLHNNVVVVDGIALVGANGWSANYLPQSSLEEIETAVAGYSDLSYLCSTLERLQLHIDVRKILVITNAVPDKSLYYGESPNVFEEISLLGALEHDTEKKIAAWIFGTYEKIVDTTIDNINYLNNTCYNRNPYYAKRIDIEL
jgi:predicted phosphohydrolase